MAIASGKGLVDTCIYIYSFFLLQEVKRECGLVCSQTHSSAFRVPSIQRISSFSLDPLEKKLSKKASELFSLLKAASRHFVLSQSLHLV